MKRLLKEPLLHFLLLGAAIFVVYGLVSKPGSEEPGRIIVSQGQIASMVEGFLRAWQRPPTREELDGLIRDRVREEVYCREAMALGLDKDDTIIRRRLRQKMEFVSDDVAAQTEPTEADLNAYLQAHPDRFRVERSYSFAQVYLNPQKYGNKLPGVAAQLLAQLNQPGDKVDITTLGDPSLLDQIFDAVPVGEIAKQFGEAFAMKLAEIKPGRWQGPVESGYGEHLVEVLKRTEGRLPALAEARDAVSREWANTRLQESNDKFYAELLKRYIVTIERPQPEKEKEGVAAAK